MKLETKRLIVREPKMSDLEDIIEGVGEYDVARMLLSVSHPYLKKEGEDFIKRKIKEWRQKVKTNYQFFIELKSEKKVIGAIGLHKVNIFNGTAETGSWINKKYWRNGYITEAKIAINDFAFNKLKIRRLDSPVFADNKASNATQLKMGYKLEGMKRKAGKSKADGKIHDENIYGLLKEDWIKAKKRRLL